MSDCTVDKEPYGTCQCQKCQDFYTAFFAIDDEGTSYEALKSILQNTDLDKLIAIENVEIFIDLGVISD